MTIIMCACCGTSVPETVATMVESMSLEGNRIWSDLCPTCAISIKESKHPYVRRGEDGKLEAVPSVPAANTCSPKVPDCAVCKLPMEKKMVRYSCPLQYVYVCPLCGETTVVEGEPIRIVGEFGHCNGGPTENRPYLTREQWRVVAEKRWADLDRERKRVACLRSRIVGMYNACCEAHARASDPGFHVGEVRMGAEPGSMEIDVEMMPGLLEYFKKNILGALRLPSEALEPEFQRKAMERAEEIRERLAAYAHEAWGQIAAANLPYLIQSLSISGHAIDACECRGCARVRRHRSLMVPYADLPENEKASDRVQADKILAILRGEG